ncbi:tRNA pseudouridine(55) synthase TruB [Altererythrobacter xixiisoli]|uniref:tRNA pseudouridine synthase B n=1 Tax=Croceibacterium xixiisoli TaxID=1476466 RepID=A0A6I4TTW2_9SPHN|nr:tRNA pseudouridine(55) synthase TruB [Croceibacterium xixiisoli]MXO98297.1 tRNA pseudouridine(55) synthase TruB [Croceibacterium xixiisoli]
MTSPRPTAQPHGWLVLDKPRGLGSTQAVAAAKRVLRSAGYGKVKIGHGGTLDPLAEGVLPIALGEATKLAGRMLDASKIYAFTIAFGEETDTLDTEGPVIATSDHRPPRAAVAAILPHFTGAIEQLPPAYSALKVDGRRAYDLARAGEEAVLQPRQVTIHSLELAGGVEERPIESAFASAEGRPDLLDPAVPLVLADKVTLIAHVSKGTYIRSLARDIAHALGTVGHVSYLRRIKAGPFAEGQAISLDILEEIGKGAPLEDHLLPLEAGLDGIPAFSLSPDSVQAARQGRIISGLPHPDGLILATDGNVPVALMEVQAGTAKVVRGFNLADTAE